MSLAVLKKKVQAQSCLQCNLNTKFTAPPLNPIEGVNINKNVYCGKSACSGPSFSSSAFRSGPNTNQIRYPLKNNNVNKPPIVNTTTQIKSSEKAKNLLVYETLQCKSDVNKKAKGKCDPCSKFGNYVKDVSVPGYNTYMNTLITKRACFSS